MRLPTESEWETIALAHGEGDNFLRDDFLDHRRAAPTPGHLVQRHLRRHLGVDLERLFALPGIPGCARRGGRVQRQVHGEPVRPPRRVLRHAGRARPPHLPQLLPARCTLGFRRAAVGPGPLSHGVHDRRPSLARGGAQPDAGRRAEGAAGRAEVHPPGVVLRRAGQPPVRGHHPAARVLPDPGRACPPRGARPVDRRTVEGRHAGRARCRSLREDPGAADGAPGDRLAGAVRALRRERRVPPRRRRHPGRGVRLARHPRGHRRLPPASRRDPDRGPADDRVLGRDDRQPESGTAVPASSST